MTTHLTAPTENAYVRKVLFALEVLDAVTLARISQELEVEVDGLSGKPVVNSSGLFVWYQEGTSIPGALNIRPGDRPYLGMSRTAAEMQAIVPAPPAADVRPALITVELPPRRDYPFGSGVTGVRGTLVERAADDPLQPVPDVPVWLQWIDDDVPPDTWRDAPIRSRSNANGDFAAVLRFSPVNIPRAAADGRLRLRVQAQRPAPMGTRRSLEFLQQPGRVTDAQPAFAWDEFLP